MTVCSEPLMHGCLPTSKGYHKNFIQINKPVAVSFMMDDLLLLWGIKELLYFRKTLCLYTTWKNIFQRRGRIWGLSKVLSGKDFAKITKEQWKISNKTWQALVNLFSAYHRQMFSFWKNVFYRTGNNSREQGTNSLKRAKEYFLEKTFSWKFKR